MHFCYFASSLFASFTLTAVSVASTVSTACCYFGEDTTLPPLIIKVGVDGLLVLVLIIFATSLFASSTYSNASTCTVATSSAGC